MLCRNPYIRDPSGKVLVFSKILGTDALGGIPFPCGQCLPCRINKRRVWTLRLMLEAYFHEKMSFATLTYSDDNLRYNDDGLPVLNKRDCQLWLKRLRKHFDRTGIRYYLAGEYGSRTHRPHYHVILFGVSPDELDPQWVSFDGKSGGVQGITRRVTPLSATWKLGLVHVGTVTRDSIQYVAGYVTKKFTKKGDSLVPEFTLQSRNPGIGAQALLELSAVFNRDEIAKKSRRQLRIDGKTWPLGRYLQSRIELVCGSRIGPDDYYEKLREAWLQANRSGIEFIEHLVHLDDGRYKLLESKDRIYNRRSQL